MAESAVARATAVTIGAPALAAVGWVLLETATPEVAFWVALPYALVLVLAPSAVYPLQRLIGSSTGRAVLAALGVPLLWLAKELHRVSGVFGAGETLFYALNPLSLGIFAFAAFQMAVAELAIRRARGVGSGLASGPGLVVTAFALLAAAAAVAGADSGGRDLFYGYIRLHTRLFAGSG